MEINSLEKNIFLTHCIPRWKVVSAITPIQITCYFKKEWVNSGSVTGAQQ